MGKSTQRAPHLCSPCGSCSLLHSALLSLQGLSQLLARRALWNSPLSVLPMVLASAYHTLNSASISPQGGGQQVHSETGEAVFLSCLLIHQDHQDISPLPLEEAGIYPLASGCPLNLPVLFNKWNQTSPLKKSLCSPRHFSEGHQKRPQRPLLCQGATWAGVYLSGIKLGEFCFGGRLEEKGRDELEMAAAPGQTGILHSSFSIFIVGTSGPPEPSEKPGGAQKGCRGWEGPPDSHKMSTRSTKSPGSASQGPTSLPFQQWGDPPTPCGLRMVHS